MLLKEFPDNTTVENPPAEWGELTEVQTPIGARDLGNKIVF